MEKIQNQSNLNSQTLLSKLSHRKSKKSTPTTMNPPDQNNSKHQHPLGIGGSALVWFGSYLTDGTSPWLPRVTNCPAIVRCSAGLHSGASALLTGSAPFWFCPSSHIDVPLSKKKKDAFSRELL